MENAEDVYHIVPAVGLAGALESHPEPRTPVYHYILEVTSQATHHDNRDYSQVLLL